MSVPEWNRRVFRLRSLPNRITNTSEACQLISEALSISTEHVDVCSLAKTLNRWELPASKVATLHIRVVPECLREKNQSNEWELPLREDPRRPLILDTHFQGLTPLNDVEPLHHHTDCIAISGLASHPFGSWQPHGDDKSFMWIRDELPRSITGIRAIIYGYKSQLLASDSFQSISDIALNLIHQLKTGGWNLESSKPIIFLAHSLGGLVLKDAIVQIADREIVSSILDRFKGAIMFGVPSLGMNQSHLVMMTKGQANEGLSQDLSRENGSDYLRRLNRSFEGVSTLKDARIYWAYETKQTRIPVKLASTQWNKNGPFAVLVNPDSATCHRNTTEKLKTIPIDENHSDMVKFSRGHKDLPTIILTIRELSSQEESGIPSLSPKLIVERNARLGTESSYLDLFNLCHQDGEIIGQFEDLFLFAEEFENKIHSPELDFRAEQIEDQYEDTFKWIFDLQFFCNWLQEGKGLFWVKGKPGSGKSTLMKYIMKSKHTWELLHDWTRSSSEVKEIIAGFFFHYRGTSLQKSFEGLLRGLTSQIISSHFGSFRNRCSELASQRDIASGLMSERKSLARELHDTEAKEKMNGQHNDEEALKLQHKRLDLRRKYHQANTKLRGMEPCFARFANRYKSCLKAPEAKFLSQVILAYRSCEDGILSKLEKTLRRILDQDILKMDLILFFDALDEFDGHPDMISKFLKSLVQQSESTRVKVCFSSRPLKSLQTHFSRDIGLSLQEYTRGDIEKYAAGNLASLTVRNPAIIRIIPSLVTRARGVFLWVRLAVKELLDASSQSTTPLSLQQMEERLVQLPDDLHEFYRLIVERISQSTRRNTYTLLELMVRGRDRGVSVQYAWEAVNCAECSTLDDIAYRLEDECTKLSSINHTGKGGGPENDTIRHQMSDIYLWGGGLVEINRNSVQAMHQTVLEFAMGLSFKKDVLGNLSNIMIENGHSFHLKYLCSGRPDNDNCGGFRYHAEQAELTTGNSQLGLLSSLSEKTLRCFRGGGQYHFSEVLDSNLLELIASNGLLLCLQDWLTENPGGLGHLVSKVAVCPLISSLFFVQSEPGVCYDRYMKMARLILENEFDIVLDPNIFDVVLTKIWEAESGTTIGQGSQVPLSVLHELAILILDHGQDPNITILIREMWTKPVEVLGPHRVRLLHLAPPFLAALLIKHGADPNLGDGYGRTPLDWVLKIPDDIVRGNRFYGSKWRFDLCQVLISAGGLPAHRNYDHWIAALEEFEAEGYDTTGFRESRVAKDILKLRRKRKRALASVGEE
ncbi:unnamed protein product [Clonostachys rosea]|uniref:Nephrocystin 3-like N-terminal domain-containing protein n=1 Tax=Bionectria ochroleuca TaxID=29856 RepID=A0ABY6UK03_BIOOC|nr:unnamed protein product [Clonostachys rosea]